MISTLANAQNTAKRKMLEAVGYKFSLGHDGWAVYFDAEVVAQDVSRRRGEGCFENNLDRAVFAANYHHQAKQKEAAMAQPKEDFPLPEPAPKKTNTLQTKAVKTAIQFLEQAGAQYKIIFDGETFTNIKAPPAAPKVDYAAHWRPILEPKKGQGAFTLDLVIPPDLDMHGYLASVRMYLWRSYGKGSTITELKSEMRVLQVMVAQVTP